MAFTAADKTGDGTTIGVVLLANCPLILFAFVNTLCPVTAAAAFLAAAPAVREAGIGDLANGDDDGVIPKAIILAVAIIEDGTAAGIAFVIVDNGARCDIGEEVTDVAAPTPALFNSEVIILFVTVDFDATDCDCGVATVDDVDNVDNSVMADLIDPGVAGGGGGMALASAAAAAAEDDVTLLVYSIPFFGIVI